VAFLIGFPALIIFGNYMSSHSEKKPAVVLNSMQQSYLTTLGYTGKSDEAALQVGSAWCSFFTTDRSQTPAMSSSTALTLANSGHDEYLISHGYDAAASSLCPGSFQSWNASMPHVPAGPYDPADMYPDPGDQPDLNYGPRG
jgi:hypothetical protein